MHAGSEKHTAIDLSVADCEIVFLSRAVIITVLNVNTADIGLRTSSAMYVIKAEGFDQITRFTVICGTSLGEVFIRTPSA